MLNDMIATSRDKVGEDNLIQALATPLEAAAANAAKVEDYGGEFKHEILLVIDKDVPFDLLTKVIYTCGKTEWYNIRLMVQGYANDIN
jgi:hypothetical protein